ncbi:MAG: hypothetical protein IT369_23300, partial [Candidatus Latescibacteria bacterium]|nr:hypothetical protein [Candidatus Latescibacterota bacterium]
MRRGLLPGVVLVFLFASGATGLVIYRLGGAGAQPPPELGGEGVQFINVPWADLEPEKAGRAYQLDISDAAIGALRLDPEQNLAVAASQQGGVHKPQIYGVAFDGDRGTSWWPNQYLCAQFSSIFHCDADYGFPGTVNLDLKGGYPLDRIRIVSGLTNPLRVARNVRVYVAAVAPPLVYDPDPFRPVAVEVRDNREQVLEIALPSNEKVGFIQVAMGEHNEDWEVHEIEV